jgi:hypothetical protein
MTRIFGILTDCVTVTNGAFWYVWKNGLRGAKAGSMAPWPPGHGDIKHGDLIVELQVRVPQEEPGKNQGNDLEMTAEVGVEWFIFGFIFGK